jgi:outer membrane protein TolC
MNTFLKTMLIPGLVLGLGAEAATVKSFKEVWTSIQNHHPELKASEEDRLASESASARASRHWLPELHLSGRGYSTNDPLMNFMGILGQRSIVASDFSPSTLNRPGSATFGQVNLGASLPLFEGGASVAASKMQELDRQGKTEMDQAKKMDVYTQTVSSYAGVLNSESTIESLQDLKTSVTSVLSRYSVGSRSNPVGYSGLLGLKSTLNRINATLNQVKVEKQSRIAEIENRSQSNWSDWTVKKEDVGAFLQSVLPRDQMSSDEPSHYLNAASAQAEAMDAKVSMQRARFLPQVGLFADGNFYLGDRTHSTAYAGGVYLRWSLFNPRDFGSVGEEQHRKLAAEHSLKVAQINEKLAKSETDSVLNAILENEKILKDSTHLMDEQVATASRLFQSGSINALQLVEVFNRRADLILQLKELNQNHIQVRTGLAKISNSKGITP